MSMAKKEIIMTSKLKLTQVIQMVKKIKLFYCRKRKPLQKCLGAMGLGNVWGGCLLKKKEA